MGGEFFVIMSEKSNIISENLRDKKKKKKRKKGAQKKRGENSPILPPLDPRLTTKVKFVRLVNKLSSIQPTIYRTGLDTTRQALLTSHPPFLLTERRSGTVLFLCLCLCLFQAGSH